jgi:predicted TIM-barrel fold metal-dependent hydrolase
MLFGSDYAIWEPKWQIEGFVDWEMPDDEAFSDFPRLGVEGKKKILGLNAAKLYDVEVPEELKIPVPDEEPASPESAVGVAG